MTTVEHARLEGELDRARARRDHLRDELASAEIVVDELSQRYAAAHSISEPQTDALRSALREEAS